MSENLKTVKELSDGLGVSKMTVARFIKNNKLNDSGKKGQAFLYGGEAVKYIIDNLTTTTATEQELKNLLNNINYQEQQIIDLKQQREYLKDSKDQQLKTKDEQIKSLVETQKQTQNLLDQQQRLALQDKQLLQEYKSENDKLKSLKAPSLEKEKEFVETMRQTYEEDLVKLNQELEERKNLQRETEEERNDLMEAHRKLLANQKLPKKWYEFWR